MEKTPWGTYIDASGLDRRTDPTARRGYRSEQAKAARRRANAAWRVKNPERHKEQRKRWYESKRMERAVMRAGVGEGDLKEVLIELGYCRPNRRRSRRRDLGEALQYQLVTIQQGRCFACGDTRLLAADPVPAFDTSGRFLAFVCQSCRVFVEPA